MKLRNYERKNTILFLTILLFIAITILIIYAYLFKIESHYLIKGVVFKDNLLEVIVQNEEKKIIHKNASFYINNKKHKYKVKDTLSDVLVKDKQNYSIIYIECNLNNEKENDIIDLVFMKERIRLIEIFKLIWKGD